MKEGYQRGLKTMPMQWNNDLNIGEETLNEIEQTVAYHGRSRRLD